MATNQAFIVPEFDIVLDAASTYKSGKPIRSQGVNGVLLEDSGNVTTDKATCRCYGPFNLSVNAVNSGGNTTVAKGDLLYIQSDGTLDRDSGGDAWGNAMEAITTSGATETIMVWIIQAAGAAGS